MLFKEPVVRVANTSRQLPVLAELSAESVLIHLEHHY